VFSIFLFLVTFDVSFSHNKSLSSGGGSSGSFFDLSLDLSDSFLDGSRNISI